MVETVWDRDQLISLLDQIGQPKEDRCTGGMR